MEKHIIMADSITISQSQCLLLEAIKASLFDKTFSYPSDICWNELVTEAKNQTVIGLIGSVIPVHDESIEQSKAFYMRMLYEQDKLLKCFDAVNIPCVILKGCSAAMYYPKPYLRSMGDIDILVPRNKFIESMELLESNAYIYDHGKEQDEFNTDIREVAYIKNGILIELHQRFSSSGVELDDYIDDAIYRRNFSELNGYKFPVLPNPENGLVLLGHINQHLKNYELGLRQIIDWEMFINSFANTVEWNSIFIPLLEKTGLLSLAVYVSRLCIKYLGLSIEVNFGVEIDDKLTDELLEAVLNDGNFGRRVYANKTFDEIKMISTSYDIRHDGFYKYFTRIGFATSSFCRNHTSLKIFAFIYGLFRQMTMGILFLFKNSGIGKKMSDANNMYKMIKKRSALYKKLGVRTGK